MDKLIEASKWIEVSEEIGVDPVISLEGRDGEEYVREVQKGRNICIHMYG